MASAPPHERPGADFITNKRVGVAGERRIEAALKRLGYRVRRATWAEQHRGIDLVLSRPDGSTTTAEVKTESTTARTGNCYIELIADDKQERRGWLHTSQADLLVHLEPLSGKYFVVPMARLREAVIYFAPICRRGSRRNTFAGADYCSTGLLMPLAELRKLAVFAGQA